MPAIKTKLSQSQAIEKITELTEIPKKEVKYVLEALSTVANSCLMKGGIGEFMVPALGVKLKVRVRPARKAGKGKNPFTGEAMQIKARKESKTVKALAMKKLKDVANT